MYLVGGEDWQTRMHKKTKVRIWMNRRITMKIDYIFISAKETIKKLKGMEDTGGGGEAEKRISSGKEDEVDGYM